MNLKKVISLAFLLPVFAMQAQDLNIHVDKKGKIGFADSNGNVVIECVYESATPFNKGASVVTKGGKTGLIDTSGKVILPLQYQQISKWNDHLLMVSTGKTTGLADYSGNIVLPVEYSLVTKPNVYKRALVAKGGRATSNENKTFMANAKYGIIDEKGHVLIDANYKGLYEFSNDCSNMKVLGEGKYLMYSYHYTVDTLVTDCKYMGFSNDGLTIFYAGVMDGTGKELVKSGLYSLVMPPKCDMVRYYMAKKKDTTCGYHNLNTGKNFTVSNYKEDAKDITFWSHGDFTGDIAPVNGTTWSFVNKMGEIVRSGYSSIQHNEELKLWAAKNASDKWDVFDESGKEITPLCGYEELYLPRYVDKCELFTAKKDGFFGAISRDGETIIPFEYEGMTASTHEIMIVKKNDKWGAVSSEGETIIPIEYADVSLPTQHDCKHFWVKKADGLFYHYNTVTKSEAGKGYKIAANFERGFAHVVPDEIAVFDIPLNRAQLFPPMTAQSTIQGADLNKFTNSFGYLVNEEDVEVMKLPVSTIYKDAVIDKILKSGKHVLTAMEQKQILLELTLANRTYKLTYKIKEEEWNY